jgi:tripartite-type tricarboxylate transporter receptor subunit TctC
MRTYSILMSALSFFSATLVNAAAAEHYPEKSVRVLVGLAPGGGTDITARLLAQKLSDVLGKAFVVDNRPRAGGNLATGLTASAAPDGYTLLFVAPQFVINPSMWRKVVYDAIRDFAPIVQVVSGQYVLSVRSSVPAGSVEQLIALAKAEPGRLSFGSGGVGGGSHLAGELFKSMAGVDITHVPYKGAAPQMNALLNGEVQVGFTSISAGLLHAKEGRIRALAVTGLKRTPIAPELPTVAESGVPGYEVTGWYGMVAPAKTPKAIINRLNTESNRVLPELTERFSQMGTDVVGGTPTDFGAFIKSELDKWAKVVKLSGAKSD